MPYFFSPLNFWSTNLTDRKLTSTEQLPKPGFKDGKFEEMGVNSFSATLLNIEEFSSSFVLH